LGIVLAAGLADRPATPYFRAERETLPMQSENRVFDDFVKMVNGFAGTFAGMGREAEASAREKMREWMAGSDFVGRDEFEAVKAMAAAARDENEALKGRIAALEAKAGAMAPAGLKRAPKPKASPGA
jgi:BMFP domain-containing protein YqiC